VEVARRLIAGITDQTWTLLPRLGGDEFVFMMTEDSDRKSAYRRRRFKTFLVAMRLPLKRQRTVTLLFPTQYWNFRSPINSVLNAIKLEIQTSYIAMYWAKPKKGVIYMRNFSAEMVNVITKKIRLVRKGD